MILSSIPAFAIWFFILAMPGIMPIRSEMPPIFAICSNCSRMSDKSNWPLRIRSAVRAAIAVDTRQHDAGEANAFVERAREIDRVLAGERIRDQQHFVRIGRGFDL